MLGTAQSLVGIFRKASLINHETKTTNIVSTTLCSCTPPQDRHGKNEKNEETETSETGFNSCSSSQTWKTKAFQK
jgi:hypothetical protein